MTGLDFERVCEGLDEAEKTLDGTALWRDLGCTAKMIFECARARVASAPAAYTASAWWRRWQGRAR